RFQFFPSCIFLWVRSQGWLRSSFNSFPVASYPRFESRILGFFSCFQFFPSCIDCRRARRKVREHSVRVGLSILSQLHPSLCWLHCMSHMNVYFQFFPSCCKNFKTMRSGIIPPTLSILSQLLCLGPSPSAARVTLSLSILSQLL
ncbi:MAG: hypothetical protein RMI04_09695, partial [Thermofilaceae archaeon]|nr:hypothetical protein [Thermofilaceae archaeon]